MHFRKNERLAIFIDGYRGITRFSADNLVRIYFYAALPSEKSTIRQLLDWLEYH
jgi:hypothetical protein